MNNEQEQFTGLFSLPGEGLLAQIEIGGVSKLYDIRGLQYLILDRKKTGKSTDCLDVALQQIRVLETYVSNAGALDHQMIDRSP